MPNLPGLVVHQQVLHMADGVIAALNVIPAQFAGAAQVLIARLAGAVECGLKWLPRLVLRIGTHAPDATESPVRRVPVVAAVVVFVSARHGLVHVDARAVLDLLFRQRQIESTVFPTSPSVALTV